jgi:hypothetical protein
MTKKQRIGTIEIGEIAFLSDPCYGTISRWNCTMSMVSGKYYAYITRFEGKSDYLKDRIQSLVIVHSEYYKTDKTLPNDDKEQLVCAVDSGTCGIFDGEYFAQFHTENDVDDDWYEKNVIEMDEFTITDGKGVISSSGIGDGCYKVYAHYIKDKAYALRIRFL